MGHLMFVGVGGGNTFFVYCRDHVQVNTCMRRCWNAWDTCARRKSMPSRGIFMLEKYWTRVETFLYRAEGGCQEAGGRGITLHIYALKKLDASLRIGIEYIPTLKRW